MKRIALYGALALTLILTSCKSEVLKFGKYWGKQVAYSNFLGYNYVPDTLKQTIRFDMGEATKPITLGVFDTCNDEITGEERMTPVVDAVELYANGKRCENHTFKIVPGQNAVELGVVFLPNAKERDYYWVLKVLDAGDADMINDNLTSLKIPILLTWKAEYDTKMNPLALGLLLGGGTILALLLLWVLILKFIIFDRFKIKHIIIEDNDSERRIMVREAISLTLSSKTQKQNILERVFVGKRLYYCDDFFSDGDVVVSPRNRKTVMLKVSDVYDIDQYTISKDDDDPSVIKNSRNQKIEIRIV